MNFQMQMIALNPRKSISESFIIAAFVSYYILCQWRYQAIGQTINHLPTEQDVIDCNTYPKDCHCGSIAQPKGTSLFIRILYPNGTTVIEEYDEDVPYGYKYLRVYYRCADEENILVGNNVRECSHGNWIGSVPRCAFNLRNNTKLKQVKIADYEINRLNSSETKNVTQSQTEKPLSIVTLYHDTDLEQVPDGTFQIPLKNQPSDCLRWSLFRKQVWSLTLTKPTRIHYVRIKLYGEQIEDLYLNREISFDMVLKNITYKEGEKTKMNQSHIKLPLELKCNSSTPSHYDSYQQKYSANYLVLEFLCEIANIQKSIFEYDGEVDQLYANVIEVRFFIIDELNEFRVTPINTDKEENLKLKDKIFKISLCELELYTFHRDCGIPDIPISAIVQRDFNFLYEFSDRKTYKYSCNDKNTKLKGLFAKYKHEIKNLCILGNSFVECGNYGKWKNQFPQCIRIVPCKLLNLTTNDQNYELNVKYESISFTKTGIQVIPEGKYARISCVYMRNKTKLSLKVNNQSHNMSTQVTIQVICRNGKWVGLEGVTGLGQCKLFFKNEFKDDKQNSTISTDNHQIVTLPVRIIQIMFGAFIVLVLIIISLCVCLIFRRSKNKKETKTLKTKDKLYDYDDHDYAEINYDLPYYSSIKLYLELHDAKCDEDGLQNNENFQYETMINDNDIVEVKQKEIINGTYTPMTSKN